jgi:hypothetical protein
MKSIKRLSLGLLVLLPIIGISAAAYAQGFRSGNDVTVASGQQVNKTLFVAGQTVDIGGTVNGDLFCAAQNLTLTGTINGDIICAAQSAQISGVVNGSVRIIGQNVTVDGIISQNLSAVGQNVTLDTNGKVTGDASIVGQTTVDNGLIGRDLAVVAKSVTINGTISRDVQSIDTSLTLNGNAKINGNLSYTSQSLLSQQGGAIVVGNISHSLPKAHQFFLAGHRWWLALYLLVAMLMAAFVAVLLLPQIFQRASDTLIREPLKTFLVGLVTSIVTPIVVVLLFVTVVGLPLGIVLLLLWLLALALTAPFAVYGLGRILLQRVTDNAIYFMLLGAVILLLLLFVPILKILVGLLTVWFGLGIIVMQLRRLPKIHYHMKNLNASNNSSDKASR